MKNKTLLKTLSTFLAVAMILCSAPLSGFLGIELPDLFSLKAEAYFTEGNFEYYVDYGKAILTGCVDATGDIVIPETLGGYPVTSIGNYAFQNCTSLESVTIPDSVTSIDYEAFKDCTNLASVTIPDSVASIGDSAFYNCTSLTDVYYTGDIESWCNISFDYAWSNPMYYAKNFYIDNTLVKEIIIPDTVTEINDCTFYSFEGITSITIPDSVTSIGHEAFEKCTSLTSIEIPDSVTSIGREAFYGTSLARVYYTGDIESWCGIEFGDCFANPMYSAKNFYINNTLVKEIVIPDTVTEIKDSAFYSFEGITSITIPDSVTSIGREAFENCTSLETVTIGNSVTSIGWSAFSGCYNLESVYYTGDIESWFGIYFEEEESNPKSYADNIYFSGEVVENIIIPEGATSIKAYAFYNFDSVKTVTIPVSVITIREDAFRNCDNIETVYYAGTDAQWNEIIIYDGNECLNLANKTFLNGGHAHVYNSTVAVEPTCTETGLKALKCYCGNTYTEVIPATGHIWGKWVVTLEPTATKDGRKVRACTVCVEAIQEEVIPKGTNPDIPDEPDDPETESAVKVSDFTLNYKGTGKINPEINVSGKYTVDYVSSDEAVVTVDKDGNVTATGEGTAEITVIVTDANGDIYGDTCKVTVAKAWWQWLIIIFLFGWIWY